MFSVDKPYLKKLLQKHRSFLFKCYSAKSHAAKKLIIQKASLFELNILLKCLFLVVHHHFELKQHIGSYTKKFLLRYFMKKEDFQKLLYSSQEDKKTILQKLVSNLHKLLSPLFDQDE